MMMPEKPIFVDTSAWYAAIVILCTAINPRFSVQDLPGFKNLAGLFKSANYDGVKYSKDSDHETVTLLQSRIGYKYAVRFLDMLELSQQVQLIFLTPNHIKATIHLFRNRADKEWSFTDCSSFIFM